MWIGGSPYKPNNTKEPEVAANLDIETEDLPKARPFHENKVKSV